MIFVGYPTCDTIIFVGRDEGEGGTDDSCQMTKMCWLRMARSRSLSVHSGYTGPRRWYRRLFFFLTFSNWSFCGAVKEEDQAWGARMSFSKMKRVYIHVSPLW